MKLLTPVCGYRDMVTVRSGQWLLGLGRRLEGLGAGEVVQYDTSPGLVIEAPIESDDGLIVTWMDHRVAITQHRPGTRPVTAGPFIADLVGVSTTARGISTMLRVIDRVRQYG